MSRADILSLFDQHGILPTPQRIEVADILLARPQHLSAEQIIEKLRDTGSSVSKATVYNTLNLFGERGLVKEVMVDPVRKFYNVDSGELSDIPDHLVGFSELPDPPEGTEAQSVELLIRVRDSA